MPVPEYLTKYYEQSPVDLVIADVVKNADGKYVASQVNRVKTIATVQVGIDKYRQGAKAMNQEQMEGETHCSSRLGEYLDATVMRRPPRCCAHAIVAGGHAEAALLRTLLAIHGMRIDDPHNGCWLPVNTAATPHPVFPKAPPHSRIHRYNYYFWLTSRLNEFTVTSYAELSRTLNRITQHLHEHTFPEYVMYPKGQSLA